MTTYEVNVLAHLNRDITIDADTEAEAAQRVEQICAALYGEDLALADVQAAEPAEFQTIIGQSEVDVTALLADGTLDGGALEVGEVNLIMALDAGLHIRFEPDALLADAIIHTIDADCSAQLDEMSDDGASLVATACEALGMRYEEASEIRQALAERVRDAMEREIAAWRVEQGIRP